MLLEGLFKGSYHDSIFFSDEAICKSFSCCGQSKTCHPEDITCLRTGAPAAEAFEAVSTMWDNPTDDGKLEELVHEIEDDQDLVLSDDDN